MPEELNYVEIIWKLLNSSFSASFTGAIAGAFAIQYVAARAAKREQLITELKNTNTAIMIAANICNSYLSLKMQHVHKLKLTFDEQQTALLAHEQGRLEGAQDTSLFQLHCDFKTLPQMKMPLDRLETLIFEKLSINGKILSITTAMLSSIDMLNDCMRQRNESIKFISSMDPANHDLIISLYFGLPDRHGNINESYRESVDGLSSFTDDCIMFSRWLCRDLTKHGENYKERLYKEFNEKPIKINKADFPNVPVDFWPSETKYESWKTAFVNHPKDDHLSTWGRIRDFVGM